MKNLQNLAICFNQPEQVEIYAQQMLNKEIACVELVTVIGHNGKEFCSTVEWLITTMGYQHYTLPFGLVPQHPTFIPAIAGREIILDADGRLQFNYNQKRL